MHGEARDLHEKYLEIRRLRRADLDGTIADPRPDMRRLAARFPGALRELDRLTLDEVERRIDHLAHVLDDTEPPEPPEPWVPVMAAFHVGLRAALRARRAGVAAEPRGTKLTSLVIVDIARAQGLTESEVLGILYPWSKR